MYFLYGISKREDGNLSVKWGDKNEVLHNRKAFLKKFNQAPENCVVMEPEHGDVIVHVTAANTSKMIIAEAFITQGVGVILFLLTADCFPVSFYDPEKQVVALAHLGWRPIDKELAAKVVTEFVKVYESNPASIQVIIGPGIHKESYRFKELEQDKAKSWSKFLTHLPNGEIQVDLIGYIRKQLLDAGICSENIEISPVDTATSDEYFSHYRSVRTGESEARFATIVGLL